MVQCRSSQILVLETSLLLAILTFNPTSLPWRISHMSLLAYWQIETHYRAKSRCLTAFGATSFVKDKIPSHTKETSKLPPDFSLKSQGGNTCFRHIAVGTCLSWSTPLLRIPHLLYLPHDKFLKYPHRLESPHFQRIRGGLEPNHSSVIPLSPSPLVPFFSPKIKPQNALREGSFHLHAHCLVDPSAGKAGSARLWKVRGAMVCLPRTLRNFFWLLAVAQWLIHFTSNFQKGKHLSPWNVILLWRQTVSKHHWLITCCEPLVLPPGDCTEDGRSVKANPDTKSARQTVRVLTSQ